MSAAQRIPQLQAAMREDGLDAVVLRLAENILLATEWFVRYPGLAFAVIAPEGPGVLVVPDFEAEEAAATFGGEIAPIRMLEGVSPGAVLGEVAGRFGATGGAIGYEGGFESIAPASFFGEPNAVGLPTKELIRESFGARAVADVTASLESIREVKTERELAAIRRTNEIAMLGLEAFKRAAVPGATEVEVMAAVEHAICVEGHGYDGAQWVRGFATVASGPRLVDGWQYFRGGTRAIEAGDAVMVEMGTVADGYWSDHTRTVVAGRATPAVAGAYAAVRHALDAAMAAARPGVTGGEVNAAARAACAEHGFTQFPHHTGHGTGFRYHESRPAIELGATDVLRAGQVIALEPGVYGPEIGTGVRHEIDAVVTAEGAIELATTDYGLDLA